MQLKNTMMLKTLAERVEYRDDISGSHIERTQSYLRILVSALRQNDLYIAEISSWDDELFLQSALLHDVGKLAIDESILRKPGKLTKEEFDKVKIHTSFGEQVIERIKRTVLQQDSLEQARVLAFTHHEKWDGSGYPRGLKGKDIPLQGRLMAIADVYDALVSDRSYKKAFAHEEAVHIIKDDSGTHFDPALVELFLSVSDEFNKINLRHRTYKIAPNSNI